jgi:adenylosuccinate lyase
MRGVQAGGNRQDLHERVRVLSIQAGARMKSEGCGNDLMERMREDDQLGPHVGEDALDPNHYVGRAPAQVDDFLEHCQPLLERHAHRRGRFTARVRV